MKQLPASTPAALSKEERQELNELITSILADGEKAPSKRAYSDLGYDLADNEEEKINIRDYWHSVRKRLWLVIGIVLLITGLVVFYVSRKPDIYQAQARIQVDVDTSVPVLSSSSKNNPVILNNPVNYPAYFNTQLKVLSGAGLLRRVVKTLDLEHNANFLPTHKDSFGTKLLRLVGLGGKARENQPPPRADEMPLITSMSTAESQADLAEATRLSPYIEALQNDLKIEPVKEDELSTKETFLIDISFTNPDRQVAAKVVNTLSDIFVLSNLEKKTQFNSTTSDYLQKRIVELQSQIRNGEERLSNYARDHQILSLDASQNTVVDRLTGLNRQLLEAENDRKLAEAAYRSALAPNAAQALAQGSASDSVKQITENENKLIELRQKRAQLLVDYTDKYPEVKQINEQITLLEAQIKSIREQATEVVVTNLETRYRQALSRENSLRAAFNQQRGETLTQNQAAINYRIIQQEIETNKELLTNLLQRSKENDVVAAGTPNNVSVIDYAPVPYKPAGPQRLLTIVVAFILSLVAGIAAALFLDYLDDTVRTVDDVEGKIHLPALAVIPVTGSSTPRRMLAKGKALQLKGRDNEMALLLGQDARSPLAEAYRQLRTSILLSTPGHAPKTLLVTSSVPSEGKTTTAVNTSISLSQTGARVLIVDADMRRPRLHSIFNIRNDRGLSTLLSSEVTDAEVHASIQKDEDSGLYLLPAGPVPPNPAELLGSDHTRRLIAMLEDNFSHVIVDSPPIASFTDGVLISTLVDGVLLVVHSGRSTVDMVKRSRKKLSDIGAKIFGVVLNHADLKHDDYSYYTHYTYSHYNNSGTVEKIS